MGLFGFFSILFHFVENNLEDDKSWLLHLRWLRIEMNFE